MKKLSLFLATAMAVSLFAACSNPSASGTAVSSAPAKTESGAKVLHLAESFAYASLDPHMEYYGWYSSIYGITETLFKVENDMSLSPLLAEDGEVSEDGRSWTITLQKQAAFSNGTPLTAEMVKRNMERLAEKNKRFSYLADFSVKVVDEHTITVTTPEVYPTLLNDLASPEMAILDLDATTDFTAAPVATGPFQVKSFVPEGTVEVTANPRYWNGPVVLDGAVFHYMQDEDAKLLAMQNGEIQAYSSVTAAAKEVLSADKNFTVTSVPATRLQFYILNERTLPDEVRAAIRLAVDSKAIAAFLGGTTTATDTPFSADAAYGKATAVQPDPEAAKAVLEKAGYTMGQNGVYEKDGKVLELNLCYYAARSLDTIAVLMQEQLNRAGIGVTLTVAEDPDAAYISTGDFDIALYCMIADKAGDPYYFINSTLAQGSYYDVGGFDSAEAEEKIQALRYETDASRRAQLANEIIQLALDDSAFGYLGLFNKTTAQLSGVTNLSEDSPFDFYRINSRTDMVSAG